MQLSRNYFYLLQKVWLLHYSITYDFDLILLLIWDYCSSILKGIWVKPYNYMNFSHFSITTNSCKHNLKWIEEKDPPKTSKIVGNFIKTKLQISIQDLEKGTGA